MLCEPLLEWSSHPFVERPITSLLLILFLILLFYILWQLVVVQWGYPLFFIGGLILIIVQLLPYFTKTKYKIYDDRIIIQYLIIKVERRFSDFGCFYADKRGIMLSTFKSPKRLDVFRGQSLRFSVIQIERDKIVEILENKVGKNYS
jgi:hypothetical protein